MENKPISIDAPYGEVLDTKKAFFHAIKQKYKKVAMSVLIPFFLICLYFIFSSQKGLAWGLGIFYLSMSVVGVSVWLIIIYLKIRTAFWKDLAKKYGWEYLPFKDVAEEKALVFNVGHSKMVPHGMAGMYKDHPFDIFEYQYTFGYGKNSTTYFMTVFEIKFKGTFPHLYLNYKGDWYSNVPSFFASLAKISVPKEFEDKFKLYSPAEYEIETLQIFTPDIFAMLLDSGWHYDMEFIDGELLIYTNDRFSSFTELDAELTKIKKFVDILSPLLNKLKLTQIGDISPTFTK